MLCCCCCRTVVSVDWDLTPAATLFTAAVCPLLLLLLLLFATALLLLFVDRRSHLRSSSALWPWFGRGRAVPVRRLWRLYGLLSIRWHLSAAVAACVFLLLWFIVWQCGVAMCVLSLCGGACVLWHVLWLSVPWPISCDAYVVAYMLWPICCGLYVVAYMLWPIWCGHMLMHTDRLTCCTRPAGT